MRVRSSSRVLLVACAGLSITSLTACGDDADATSGGGGDATGSGLPSAVSSGTSGEGGAASSSTGAGASSSTTASGSNGTGTGTGAGGGANGDAPTTTVAFRGSSATILNPERGFYSAIDLLGEDDLSWVIERGHTLAYSYVMLDEFRDEPLPGSLLDAIDASMAVLRESGLKVVLRFAYNFGPWPDSEPDAPLAQVLEHIEQVTPVLAANKDVIALLQGGFVGAWGEWHTSTNGLDEPAARQTILEALLDAMPEDRSVVLRYPPHKEAIFGDPLDAASAWSGSDAARTGHHNDCFLSSDTDVGTYPDDEVEQWKQYLEVDTRFVPMGGETCAPFPPRSECDSALEEMARLHFTFLNQDYHPDIIDSWIEDGCKEEMDQRLGYRLVLTSADLPAALRPGGSFVLRLRIRNDGFAAPINPRALRVVLEAGGERHDVELPGADARRLLAGEEVEIAARVRVPASLAEGQAQLSLWMPDADLVDDARQAIQLANQGLWDGATGDNRLGTVDIAAGAPGDADPAVTELTAEPLP